MNRHEGDRLGFLRGVRAHRILVGDHGDSVLFGIYDEPSDIGAGNIIEVRLFKGGGGGVNAGQAAMDANEHTLAHICCADGKKLAETDAKLPDILRGHETGTAKTDA